MNWTTQVLTLVILPKNGGTKQGRVDISWSTEFMEPGLSLVLLRMEPDLPPTCLHEKPWKVSNINDVKNGTSFLSSIMFLGKQQVVLG